MRWESLVLAAAVIVHGLLGRYELGAGGSAAFRIDRLTGTVERCYSAGSEVTGKVLCGDAVDEREALFRKK